MPDESTSARFDRAFRAEIERFRKPLTTALRAIVAVPPPPEVKILSFEMLPDWREFPVYAFAMDDEAPDESYFEEPFNGDVLPDAGPLIREGVIDQEAYEDAGIDTFERGARVLAEWFSESWHAAGGANFPQPAYINLHDSPDYYDLRSQRWVDQADVWP